MVKPKATAVTRCGKPGLIRRTAGTGTADPIETPQARHRSADDINGAGDRVSSTRSDQAWAHARVSSAGSPRCRDQRPDPRCAGLRSPSARTPRTGAPAGRSGGGGAGRCAPGRPQPADFALTWHNDFLKAQTGTFVPFIVIAPRAVRASDALLYVRAAPHPPSSADARQGGRRPKPSESAPPLYPGNLSGRLVGPAGADCTGVRAGGRYQITVVVRERERDDQRGRRRLAAVLRQPLSVPDYATGTLATSTVMLASRLTVLSEPRPPRPSPNGRVIGTREIVGV